LCNCLQFIVQHCNKNVNLNARLRKRNVYLFVLSFFLSFFLLPAARVETEISLGLSLSLFQNGDGFISAKELGVLMRTLGRNPTEDEIMHIMNEIDVDHNGKLDFSEFTVMMRDKLTSEDMELEIKQAFRYVITIRILTHSL
jgi:hypothetical protein